MALQTMQSCQHSFYPIHANDVTPWTLVL